MSNYPSDLGHWERINDSASSVVGDPQKLNLPVIVQDVCRALIDLRHLQDEAEQRVVDEDDPLDESIKRGIAQAADGDLVYLGSFADPLDENDHRDRLDGAGSPITREADRSWTHPACTGFASLAALEAMFGPLTFAPDPLDEDDHRDRIDGAGDRWVHTSRGCWHIFPAACVGDDCHVTLTYISEVYGPLTFAPEPAPDGARDDELEPQPAGTYEPTTTIYCHEQDCEAVITGPSHEVDTLLAAHKATHQAAEGDASEALLCPKCGHEIDQHTYIGGTPDRCWVCACSTRSWPRSCGA